MNISENFFPEMLSNASKTALSSIEFLFLECKIKGAIAKNYKDLQKIVVGELPTSLAFQREAVKNIEQSYLY